MEEGVKERYMRKYEVVESGTRPHVHNRPGPLRRWLKGMRQGAIIKCPCGAYFILKESPYSYKLSWSRINQWEHEKYGVKKNKTDAVKKDEKGV